MVEDIVQKSPEQMMMMIDEHFAEEFTAKEDEPLMNKAQTTRIRHAELLEDFVRKHREIIQDNIRAKCLGFENENTTVTFIINGLQA